MLQLSVPFLLSGREWRDRDQQNIAAVANNAFPVPSVFFTLMPLETPDIS
jgi:hypothetical protein